MQFLAELQLDAGQTFWLSQLLVGFPNSKIISFITDANMHVFWKNQHYKSYHGMLDHF